MSWLRDIINPDWADAEKKEFQRFSIMLSEAKRNDSAVELEEGVTLVNATPHELKFDDGTALKPNKFFMELLRCSTSERPVEIDHPEIIEGFHGVQFVQTSFKKAVQEEIAEALIKWAKQNRVLLIASIISVQAFGFPVVSPIVTPETSKLPPNQRICFKRKFNTTIIE